jgi:hypothetical protein
MKVTKQHKVLGGIVLVGAVVLACDQFLIRGSSGEESAPSASEYTMPVANTAPVKAAPVAANPAAPAPAVSVAQRLRQAGKAQADNTARDAFAPPAAWTAPQAVVFEADNSVQKFRDTHRLTGILSSGGKSSAMVDGKMVTVGQTIDGFVLTSISHRTASFESGANKVVLTMTERSGAAVANVAP